MALGGQLVERFDAHAVFIASALAALAAAIVALGLRPAPPPAAQ